MLIIAWETVTEGRLLSDLNATGIAVKYLSELWFKTNNNEVYLLLISTVCLSMSSAKTLGFDP